MVGEDTVLDVAAAADAADEDLVCEARKFNNRRRVIMIAGWLAG